MAERFSAERFRFLFRQDRGTIDASTWRSTAAMLAVLFVLAAAAEWVANGFGTAIGIGVTAIFILVAMLIAACWYFLSAKRFRDRGRPPVLALVLPVVLLLVGALHFLQPRGGGYYPLWFATLGDIVLTGVVVWTIVELGFLETHRSEPPS